MNPTNPKNPTTKKSSKKVRFTSLLVILFLAIGTLWIVYGVVIPAKMNHDVPGMKKYLSHEGYPNAEMKSMNSLTYTVNFTSSKGDVSVRYSRNGLYQIVY